MARTTLAARVVDHEIDHAPNRTIDRNLEHARPAPMQDPDERFGDPRLNRIGQAGSGARVEPNVNRPTERSRDRGENREARLSLPALDE
jgi:hypothetical protein